MTAVIGNWYGAAMAMNVEAEIRELQRRVSEIEGPFAFLTRQVQGVHKDLLSFEPRTEERFESVSGRFDRVEGKIDVVEGKVDNLAKALPGIVGDALREVLRAQSK